MNLDTITMEPEAAKEALKQYRDAVKATPRAKLNEARREYDRMDRAIMRGYREIAKGHQLLELSKAIVAGGVTELTWDSSWWNTETRRTVERTSTGWYPKLAVSRADARHVFCSGISSEGEARFFADDRWSRRRADRIMVDGFVGPYKTGAHHQAIVPTVPPMLRPPHSLSGYHLLWEAHWELAPRNAPGDPALLKHLDGDLYVVLAVWDLTDLERAVLGGMRAE